MTYGINVAKALEIMTNSSFFIHSILVRGLKIILRFIPKEKGLILFSAWFGQKYADNTRYTFETMLSKEEYRVKWYTVNKELYKELKSKSIPVVYGRSLVGIWQQIRAQMLVSTIQFGDFNQYFLSNCIYLDLDHGFSLKEVGLAIPGTDGNYIKFQLLLRDHIDYWMSASSHFCMEKICECYKIEPAHVVKCNKPRTDVLFDKELREGKNILIDKIKDGRKAIVWMPTHRSCGDVKMPASQIFDLTKMEMLCKERDFVFIIKKHFYHREETEDFSKYPHIFDVTQEDVDAQVILSQSDALISDYSSSYIEYLILDRPIILYAYDKEEYLKNERGLYIPLSENTAGEVVFNSDSLLNSVERITEDWYDRTYAEGRHKARDLYFDAAVPTGRYREQAQEVIVQLMKGTYKPEWS